MYKLVKRGTVEQVVYRIYEDPNAEPKARFRTECKCHYTNDGQNIWDDVTICTPTQPDEMVLQLIYQENYATKHKKRREKEADE